MRPCFRTRAHAAPAKWVLIPTRMLKTSNFASVSPYYWLVALTTVDLTHWPILVVNAPPGFTDAELQAYYDSIGKAMLARPEPYANIIDARNAPTPTASQRKIMAGFRERHAQHIRQYCRGSAFVFESAVMRGIITAIHWLRQPEMPHKSFATMFEAMTWARAQLNVGATGAADASNPPRSTGTK